MQAINAWIRAKTANDPEAITSGWKLDGTDTPGTNYRSMAFVAPFGVGAMVDAANQAWLNDVWDLVVATPVGAEGYYRTRAQAAVDDRDGRATGGRRRA